MTMIIIIATVYVVQYTLQLMYLNKIENSIAVKVDKENEFGVIYGLLKIYGLDVFYIILNLGVVLFFIIKLLEVFLIKEKVFAYCVKVYEGMFLLVGLIISFVKLHLIMAYQLVKVNYVDYLSEIDVNHFLLNFVKDVRIIYTQAEYKAALKNILENEYNYEYVKMSEESRLKILEGLESMKQLKERIAEYINAERNPDILTRIWEVLTSPTMYTVYTYTIATAVVGVAVYFGSTLVMTVVGNWWPSIFGSPVNGAKVERGMQKVEISVDMFTKGLEELRDFVMHELVPAFHYQGDIIREVSRLMHNGKLIVTLAKYQVDLHKIGNFVKTEISKQLNRQFTDRITEQVSDQVADQISKQVNEQVTKQISKQVNEQFTKQVTEHVTKQVTDQFSKQIADQISRQVAEQVVSSSANGVVKDLIVHQKLMEKSLDEVKLLLKIIGNTTQQLTDFYNKIGLPIIEAFSNKYGVPIDEVVELVTKIIQNLV